VTVNSGKHTVHRSHLQHAVAVQVTARIRSSRFVPDLIQPDSISNCLQHMLLACYTFISTHIHIHGDARPRSVVFPIILLHTAYSTTSASSTRDVSTRRLIVSTLFEVSLAPTPTHQSALTTNDQRVSSSSLRLSVGVLYVHRLFRARAVQQQTSQRLGPIASFPALELRPFVRRRPKCCWCSHLGFSRCGSCTQNHLDD
jgi:hypothetical protein